MILQVICLLVLLFICAYLISIETDFKQELTTIAKKINQVLEIQDKILSELKEVSSTVDSVDEVVFDLHRYNDLETISQLRNTLITACKKGRLVEIEEVAKAFDTFSERLEKLYQIEIPETSKDIIKMYSHPSEKGVC